MVKLQPKCNFEIAKGTPQQASDYCKKGQQSHKEWDKLHQGGPNFGLNAIFEEDGTLPLTGSQTQKRNWEEAFKLAKQHRTEEIPANILMPYYNCIKRIQQDYPMKPADLTEMNNIWYHGAPGVGKSRQARVDFDHKFFDKSLNKWWDGYRNEDNVLLDDFDKAHSMLASHLKRWCDWYSFPAEIKGTTTFIRPKRITVTSNYHPQEIFDCPKLVEAIKRRFKILEVLPA